MDIWPNCLMPFTKFDGRNLDTSNRSTNKANMPTITLVNEGVMKCRFRGLYYKLMRGDVGGAIEHAQETLDVLKNAVVNHMTAELTNYCADMLELTIIELNHHNLGCTFDRIKTLAFTDILYV